MVIFFFEKKSEKNKWKKEVEWGKGTHRVVVPNKRDGYVNATAAVASELDFQEKKSQCPSTFYVMLRYGYRTYNVCTRALNFFS